MTERVSGHGSTPRWKDPLYVLGIGILPIIGALFIWSQYALFTHPTAAPPQLGVAVAVGGLVGLVFGLWFRLRFLERKVQAISEHLAEAERQRVRAPEDLGS